MCFFYAHLFWVLRNPRVPLPGSWCEFPSSAEPALCGTATYRRGFSPAARSCPAPSLTFRWPAGWFARFSRVPACLLLRRRWLRPPIPPFKLMPSLWWLILQTGQFSLFRVLGSPFRPLWPLRLLAILRWLRPPFLSIAADRDDHSSAVAADYGRLFLDADYVSVEATPVAPERFSIIDRASRDCGVSRDPRLPDSPPRFGHTLPSFSCWSPDRSERVSASTSSPSSVLGASLP
jgi:hypothetical protein